MIKLKDLIFNSNNPRFIRDEAFESLMLISATNSEWKQKN